MAVFVPRWEELANLPTPMNPGEWAVAQSLRRLDDAWRVHVEPRLLMDKPDFVVTHPNYGVCAIEVKDWDPGLYQQTRDGRIWVLKARAWQPITDEAREPPRFQAHRYRNTIFERFFALPETTRSDFAVVRGVVVLPRYTGAEARRLLYVRPEAANWERRIPVYGRDDLEKRLLKIVTGYDTPWGMRVPQQSLRRLHVQLMDPEVLADQRAPLRMSDDARNVARNPSKARVRRVRGPAGSGKSLGLAARAATLAAAGQRVLVVGYNITLPHFLHDLAARHGRELGASIRNIEFTHFHGFCNHVRQSHKAASGQVVTADDLAVQGDRGGDCEWIVDEAIEAYSNGYNRYYDSILVDEGQDFIAKWWNFLRELVWGGSGEMLLVADTAQDVYNRSWLDEQAMPRCGFRGWTDLAGCYRMPPDLVPIVARFAERYLGKMPQPLTVPADRDACEPTVRVWKNTDEAHLAEVIVAQVHRLLDIGLAPADIAYLCEDHAVGLEAAQLLEGDGVYASHVFTEQPGDERQQRKRRFWGGADGVKGCTVHSFKGWEARGVVLAPTDRLRSQLLTYVALTRVKGYPGPRSAHVAVANANPRMRDFAAEFEGTITTKEAPGLRGNRRLDLNHSTTTKGS